MCPTSRGLSPFNPESVAIEAGRLMLSRIAELLRRYYEGIDNLFRIYMPIVDTWVLVDNSVTPRGIIATGGCGQELVINKEVEYKKIEAYVKH